MTVSARLNGELTGSVLEFLVPRWRSAIDSDQKKT